jgi:hypothetical protein
MENLGKLGKDKVTGFEGIIFAKVIHLFGCNHYELKPKVKDGGKLKKTESFDERSIEIIGEGITVEGTKAENLGGENLNEVLGKLGRDKATGFEGIIVAKGIHLFGSDTYALSPKAKDGEVKFARWFDVGRIEITDDGITAEEVKGEKPGGEILSTSDNRVL